MSNKEKSDKAKHLMQDLLLDFYHKIYPVAQEHLDENRGVRFIDEPGEQPLNADQFIRFFVNYWKESKI